MGSSHLWMPSSSAGWESPTDMLSSDEHICFYVFYQTIWGFFYRSYEGIRGELIETEGEHEISCYQRRVFLNVDV